MDNLIKKRLKTTVVVHPYIGQADGDSTFGTDIEIKGYVVPQKRAIINRQGVTIELSTLIIVDGASSIKEQDEIELPFGARSVVQKIGAYQGLNSTYELLEVWL